MAANLWFICSFSAAIMWGFGYAMAEKILRAGISPPMMMALTATVTLPFCLLTAHLTNTLGSSLQTMAGSKTTLLLAIVVAFSVVVGNILILHGVMLKNATLANLIEISYPVFTFFFAWLIFRDVQLNLATAIGGMLIFSGVVLIYLKN